MPSASHEADPAAGVALQAVEPLPPERDPRPVEGGGRIARRQGRAEAGLEHGSEERLDVLEQRLCHAGRVPSGEDRCSRPSMSSAATTLTRRMGTDRLVIHGAREHNLKNVTLELPRDRLIVFTGLSGSGKSSLAFDTIYAEGQRRYVESLSAYARQFLGSDGEARRRLHRGAVACDLDRSEVHVAEPDGPPSARSPRSTTTCECSTRGSAIPIATTADGRSGARPPIRSSTR